MPGCVVCAIEDWIVAKLRAEGCQPADFDAPAVIGARLLTAGVTAQQALADEVSSAVFWRAAYGPAYSEAVEPVSSAAAPVVLIVEVHGDWRAVVFESAEVANAWKVANRHVLTFASRHPGTYCSGIEQYTPIPLEQPDAVRWEAVAEAVGPQGVAVINRWAGVTGEELSPDVAGRVVFLLDDRLFDVDAIGAVPLEAFRQAVADARA